MTPDITVGALVGERVRLEPMALAHVTVLAEAAEEDRATFEFTRVPHGRDAMTQCVDELVADYHLGLTVPFAQVAIKSNRPLGVTR